MPDPTPAAATMPAWSAQSAVDPNTMQAVAPAVAPTATAPATESFEDMWKNAPESNGTTRTWVDPTLRATPQGQFVDAWYDTPATQPAQASIAQQSTPLTGLIDTLQTTAAPAAAPAAAPGTFDLSTQDGMVGWVNSMGAEGSTE